MAEKNDPSIYDDRSTIGSSDELDEYGVWVKTEPQDVAPGMEDLPDIDAGFTDMDLPDFSAEAETGAAEAETGIEETANSGLEFEEIPENSDLPEGLEPSSVDRDGFTEVSMTDFLDSGSEESVDFGELDSALPDMEEEPAIEPVQAASAPSQGASSAAADLSNQLLMKIADELSSIKKELSSLKSELAVVRDGSKAEAPDSKGGGFFDEEDDEKIALTGDELDNILNTANFTEEAGEGVSDDLDIGSDSFSEEISLSGQDNILSEDPSGDFGAGGISFDEDVSELNGAVKVEDEIKNLSEDFDVSLDLNAADLPDFGEEPDDLNILRQDGAAPITPAPEDTSYLDEDPLAADFSGAAIDEPDLSAGITENPLSEPAIDNISIDMEMEEQIAPEAASGSDDFVFETEDTMEIPSDGAEISITPDSAADSDFAAPDFTADSDFTESPAADFTEDSGLSAGDTPDGAFAAGEPDDIPSGLKEELKTVLSYMDQLLESLPEDKIEEFAKSEYFDTYKKLFEELGLV